MPLYHTDDQAMLKDTVAPFMADTAPVAALRKLRADETGFSRDLWKQFAEMGFTGMLVPESQGGLGMGHAEVGIVLEEIGRNLTVSPFLSTSVGAVAALRSVGGAQADLWLPRIASGEAIVALGIDEGTKHRPDRIATKAERAGNGFKLSGSKSCVAFGHVADMILVAARTSGASGEQGLTLFAVPRDAAGVTTDPRRLVDGTLGSAVTLNDVMIDADAVIGEVDHGWAALKPLLAAARTGLAAELIGVGQGAADMTLTYLKQRKQFGKLIGSFQALQHRAAHLYSELEIARASVMKAQQLLDEGNDGAELMVSVAKAKASQAANLAVREGVQMHGGIGMTDEYDIGLYMKRDRALAEYMGDAHYHIDRVARLNGY